MVAYGLVYWYNGHIERRTIHLWQNLCLQLNYHIIWRTKYRNQVINPAISARLKDILYDIAAEYGFTISHLEVGLDISHIHLMVSSIQAVRDQYCPLAEGTSARFLPRVPRTEEVTGKDRHLWAPSYFVESIGTTNERHRRVHR